MRICNKTAYRDMASVRQRLSRKHDGGNKTPRAELCRGAYWCEQCAAYHLHYHATGRKSKIKT